MRAPPPVEVTSALGRAWRAAFSLLAAMSVAVPIAWSLPYLAADGDGRQPDALFDVLGNPVVQLALVLWVAAMGVAAFWLARHRVAAGRRTLRWDGQDWVLAGSHGGLDQRGDAALMLDLGPWMLVRFLPYAGGTGSIDGFGAATWLPLTVGGDLARWAALRGALWNWRSQGARRP